MVGDAASSVTRALRAGLLEGAAAELIVGAFEAAAREDETTWTAAETCGPPEAGVAPAADAPDVAWRLTLLDEAATSVALPEAEPVVASATLLAVAATFGVACETLRPAVATAVEVATAGAATVARCGLVEGDLRVSALVALDRVPGCQPPAAVRANR